MTWLWPTPLDFYVYGEPVFMLFLFVTVIMPWYLQQKRKYIRRLIIEQPT
jgi:hypothetical protein